MGIAYSDRDTGYRGRRGFAPGSRSDGQDCKWRRPYPMRGYVTAHLWLDEEGRCKDCGKKPRTKVAQT